MIQAYLCWLKSTPEIFDILNITPTLSTARMEGKQGGMVAWLAHPDSMELALPGEQHGPLPNNDVWGALFLQEVSLSCTEALE